MEETQKTRPDYIFEVSWEVCNKVGGIHTVLATKSLTLIRGWEDQYILLGPDLWKGSGEHPEFSEDPELFKTLRKKVEDKGLKIRVGRWKITGNPIVFLVDYTSLFPTRNEIFKNLWNNFQVDSLGGGWDYIEPALFGYASGIVLECFYQCHLTLSDKIVAQFHEWLTAAGVLYIEKNVPQIATIFTTHATVVGRTIAGKGLPFYTEFSNFNVNLEAKKDNVTSKHSLEKAGAQFADCFTTVSNITAKECVQFLEKKPDVITINGFDDTIVPVSYQLKQRRLKARKKLLNVAKALTGGEIPEDCFLLIKSGRYEFRNKGIDVFIEALANLRESRELKKEVIGFIFVPTHHTGPILELKKAMEGNGNYGQGSQKILTHHLQGKESDSILQHIGKMKFENNSQDKVKIIFAPVYLNGSDGIFDLDYYNLLPAFDLSVFPSYYEPWGYTPLESIAFHIPTVTSDVAGFGQYMQAYNQGVYVVHREDNNNAQVVKDISRIILQLSENNEEQLTKVRNAAYELSKNLTWRTLIENYKEAYSIALIKTQERQPLFKHDPGISPVQYKTTAFPLNNEPVWRKIYVKPVLPEELKALEELSNNLWWSWNTNAIALFKNIDGDLWKQSGGNPNTLLNLISFDNVQQLIRDASFKDELEKVMLDFRTYLARPFQDDLCIAYFCMEFGLESHLKIYSGGLGILAGDYLKEASDQSKNLIGVGLLYRRGYLKQKISLGGDQIVEDDLQKFTQLPLEPVRNMEGEWVMINIGLPGRTLFAKVWRVPVGRTSLYLLDTDIPENHVEDRKITSQLYTGDTEMRLKQELLLGIGGVRLLNLLNISPNIYHCNEGHAAFLGIERMYRGILEDNLSYEEVYELIRASTLFTSHTTVKAGHDQFQEDLIRTYLAHYTEVLNISWEELIALGRSDSGNRLEPFSMSNLAGRISQEINGVSLLNEIIGRKSFQHLWKGFVLSEIPFGHVTNGVHLNTWTSKEWQALYTQKLGLEKENADRKETWEKIGEFEDILLWETHLKAKGRLIKRIREKLKFDLLNQHESRKGLMEALEIIREDFLLIGFARRFATYKRSTLIFSNLERLGQLLNDPKRPVIILLSGKAHPADHEGQNLIREVISYCYNSAITGKVIFLEDYNMDIARDMVQGVDLWLNTPERGMEASGTSGMKAIFNGVLNFSTLDGWWYEAYEEGIGWALPENPYIETQHIKEFDAGEIYRILETQIIPEFFERENGLPLNWIAKMKNSIIKLAPVYNTKRMLEEYYEKYYNKFDKRLNILKHNKFEKLKELIIWKKRIAEMWPNIEVKSLKINDSASSPVNLGGNFIIEVEVDLAGLDPADISLEVLLFEKNENGNQDKIFLSKEIQLSSNRGEVMIYKGELIMSYPGVFYHSLRIHPQNPLLPNICDFPVITYI